MWKNEMPLPLKLVHGLFSLLVTLTLTLGFIPWPNAKYGINNTILTYKEFWLTGLAPLVMSMSLAVGWVCYGIGKRKRWAKYALPALLDIVCISIAFVIGTLSSIVISILVVLGASYYLKFRSSKRRILSFCCPSLMLQSHREYIEL